jgi:isopentenyldiphosphate isomerase
VTAHGLHGASPKVPQSLVTVHGPSELVSKPPFWTNSVAAHPFMLANINAENKINFRIARPR